MSSRRGTPEAGLDLSGSRTGTVERGKRIFSIAVSAALLGVPVFGLPGPGHHAPAQPSAQSTLTSDHRDGGNGDGHGQGNAYGHDQAGGWSNHGNSSGNPGNDQGAASTHSVWSP